MAIKMGYDYHSRTMFDLNELPWMFRTLDALQRVFALKSKLWVTPAATTRGYSRGWRRFVRPSLHCHKGF